MSEYHNQHIVDWLFYISQYFYTELQHRYWFVEENIKRGFSDDEVK